MPDACLLDIYCRASYLPLRVLLLPCLPLSFLVAARHPDIAPLIEYTYANFPAGVANCNLLLPRCAAILISFPVEKKFIRCLLPKKRERFFFFVFYLRKSFSPSRNFFTLREALLRKKSRRRRNRNACGKKNANFYHAFASPTNDERLSRGRRKKFVSSERR